MHQGPPLQILGTIPPCPPVIYARAEWQCFVTERRSCKLQCRSTRYHRTCCVASPCLSDRGVRVCVCCSLCESALTTWETTSELYKTETRAVLDWKLFNATQVTAITRLVVHTSNTTSTVVVVVVATTAVCLFVCLLIQLTAQCNSAPSEPW